MTGARARLARPALALGVAVLVATPSLVAQAPGFAPAGWRAQQERERRFLAVPSADSADRHVRALTARPHLSGTEGARVTAEWLRDRMRGLGFETRIDTYDVWLPHPARVRVAVLQPAGRELAMRELRPDHAPAALAADAPELIAWNAYAADGTAEAEVVYANYGLPEDYAALERLGVEVRGRIVLARFGRAFRGVKAHQAEVHGAAGLLLFPDPSGDGWAAGDTLPGGPFRPSGSVQRGTVEYMWRYTGDPLTPGAPSRPGVPRLEPSQATNLPRIPVAPISYAEAERLLRELGGPDAPASFRGALPVDYRPGPGPLRVRLEVRQDFASRPVRNVIAWLPGETGQHIVIGNHYDAWILGGADPHSGTAATLELARGLAALARTGWRPRRGITIAFWDAEEFGAIGSTEWVEEHIDALRERAVAYFNVDMFTAGILDVSGSPALRDLVVSAAEAVPDPVTGRPLAALWRERQAGAARADAGAPLPRLTDIGAGSDWTAFLHFAGVPSLQWTMNGRGAYGVYHSVLDDYPYYRRWADSAFVHTPALASVMGIAALRLADADALPFRYSDYALRIDAHLRSLERAHGIALDAQHASARRLHTAALALERHQARALLDGDAATLRRIDTLLPRVEQAFLDPEGLPGRPWYRHLILAPGADTGYDALPLAPVVEALGARDAVALDRALDRLAAALDRAAALLEGTP